MTNATIINVNWDGSGDKVTVQAGINAATHGDTVLIAPGTYYENVIIDSLNIWLASWFLTTDNKAYIDSTIIDGGGISNVIHVKSQAVGVADSISHITGLTIQNSGNCPEGGGIFCDHSDPEIMFNKIRYNNVWDHGAGIAAHEGGSPTIYNNVIYGNYSSEWGGGIHLYRCRSKVYNNYIYGNQAGNKGGAIAIDSLYQSSSPSKLDTIYIMNNTIVGNYAPKGGGICIWRKSTAYVLDNIFWGNDASPDGTAIYIDALLGNCHLIIDYNNIEGGTGSPYIHVDPGCTVDFGTGSNISTYPAFENMASNNYHLLSSSPCIDAGIPDTTGWGIPAEEWDQQARVIDGRIEIGADEFMGECDYEVTHDYEPMGTLWGNTYGDNPGDVAFTEDGIPVILENFYVGSTPAFNEAEIVAAFGNFGNNQSLQLDNIAVEYDISVLGIPVNEVSFEFVDMGGTENFKVNGGTLYTGDIESAPANIAPGVTYSVVTYPVSGGIRGEVTLTGNVQSLLLGGQEFLVDEICVIEGEQSITLEEGYQFVSTYLILENPDMMVVLDDLLDNGLNYVRNSDGDMFHKIGPNWINNIGDWNTLEGYLFRMNSPNELFLHGEKIDPATEIELITGYQFISYLLDYPVDAITALDGIIGENLDFVRNSNGDMLRKIGPTWVNGIGELYPDQGYLIKMINPDALVYNPGPKSLSNASSVQFQPSSLMGNPADPVFTLYLEPGNGIKTGDRIAAFDGEKMVGETMIQANDWKQNALAAFSTLSTGKGYEVGHPIRLKVFRNGLFNECDFELMNIYEAHNQHFYPDDDGIYSIAKVSQKNLSSPQATEQVFIYPNPASEKINIRCSNRIENVRLLNTQGVQVANQAVKELDVKIDVSAYSKGIYTVDVTTASGTYTNKVIIE